MNTTFRIAKLELNTLFYSPIAWLLSIVFLFQCGLAYTSVMERLLTSQALGGMQLQFLNFSTVQVFGLQGGLLGDVLRKIYLYLPLLTMGLISREMSSGTIKLLYSSPVKIGQIILGKFAAMMAYNLVLIFILLIFALTGAFNIKSVDTGFIFPGILGVYLLLCAYAAIGLFMSCLTSYQVVAALSTLVVFAILAYIGTIWQDIDFVRDLTYFLSVTGRAERMLYGLISTKDVMYFLVIIFIFLSFSFIRLQSERESKSVFQIGGRYILVFLIGLTVGYITSLPGFVGYYDATAGKSQTLTVNTQKVIKELGDEPLEITSYINLVDANYMIGKPDQRNSDLQRWERYLRFKPNIKLKYVYYYDVPGEEQHLFEQYHGKSLKQIAEQQANSWKTDLSDFKSPAEIRKIIDLRPEKNRYVMQLRFKGKTTFLRVFDDNERFPSETEVAAALKRLIVKLPRIVFLKGEFERNKDKNGDKDYGILVSQINNRSALVNQGFDTDTLSLMNKDIPAGIAALVIADPRTAFAPEALAKIQQYIKEGGNLLIAGEPGKQDVLNPVINPLGVQLMDGTLVEKSKDNAPNMIHALFTKTSAGLSEELKKDFEDKAGVTMPGAAGLTYQTNGPFKITPLLVTDEQVSWNKKGKLVLDSADVVFSAVNGDEKRSVPTALALTRNINGKEQRVVITGDADFLSSAELRRWGGANADFNTPLMGWFTYGQFPIDTSRPGSKDNRINLTYKGMLNLKIILLGVLPGLLAILATIFLIRRKRK